MLYENLQSTTGTGHCKAHEQTALNYFGAKHTFFITAARPAYAGTEGCYRLLVFIFFVLNELFLKRPKVLWRQIWQDVGPGWEGVVRKFQTNPSRGFSRGSEKLSKKYAFSDLENFRPKIALQWGCSRANYP